MVANELQQRILNHTWDIGERIPSEKELSEEFNVNRLTVRLAINKLNTLGILETKSGEGTFVKRLDMYNYINQIIPFIISSQNLNHILDFEKQLMSLPISEGMNKKEKETVIDLEKTTKENIEMVEKIYEINGKYDKESLDIIVNSYWELKKILINKNSNKIFESIYLSLKDLLIEQDLEEIKNLPINNFDSLMDRFEVVKKKLEGN